MLAALSHAIVVNTVLEVQLVLDCNLQETDWIRKCHFYRDKHTSAHLPGSLFDF